MQIWLVTSSFCHGDKLMVAVWPDPSSLCEGCGLWDCCVGMCVRVCALDSWLVNTTNQLWWTLYTWRVWLVDIYHNLRHACSQACSLRMEVFSSTQHSPPAHHHHQLHKEKPHLLQGPAAQLDRSIDHDRTLVGVTWYSLVLPFDLYRKLLVIWNACRITDWCSYIHLLCTSLRSLLHYAVLLETNQRDGLEPRGHFEVCWTRNSLLISTVENLICGVACVSLGMQAKINNYSHGLYPNLIVPCYIFSNHLDFMHMNIPTCHSWSHLPYMQVYLAFLTSWSLPVYVVG